MATKSAVTILSGQTISDETPAHSTIVGLVMPGAFTGTALTFQGSADGVTFQPIYDDTGLQVSVAVAANRAIGLDTKSLPLSSWAFLKLVSNGAEGADRVIQLCFKA